MYINWGKIEETPFVFIPYGLKHLDFVPDKWEVQYLHRLPGRVAFSRWTVSLDFASKKQRISSCRNSHPYTPPSNAAVSTAAQPSASTTVSSHAGAQNIPLVDPSSGQAQDEDISNFFRRRQKRTEERILHETAEDRRRRQQREETAAKGEAPGNKGPRVYVWEEINGTYIRTPGGRRNYADLWDRYGPEQRRYNSYYHEWDLCSAFGEEDGDPSDDEDDPSYRLPLSTLQKIETEEDDDDGELDYPRDALQAGSDTIVIPPIALTFKEMARLRFGCTVSDAGDEDDINIDSTLTLPLEIVAMKLLGEFVPKKKSELASFRLFLAHCKDASSLSAIPRDLLDYHQQYSELHSNWTVQLRRAVLNGEVHYLISEKTCERWRGLCVAVKSATNALEIVRQGWGPSLTDVMENLLSRGMPFNTFCRFEKVSGQPSPRSRYSGLGFRPRNYKPDLIDYHTYISHRRAFLRGPRGRAAILYGGVIGRIARSEASVEDVFRGPSDQVLDQGICLWDGSSSYAYWDDCLTDQEIDLVCGVYHVATG
ncbi:hypothetical protein DFH09DRAFT_930757 [Mycena vulgaris]|nr:hypothetical protein DFH09DRAFT_958879 [Mycena vulgaris]KAJ6537545.1 hypothetical protein DFH09DRAFT_930757 [Mycena vulgaris]